jgi:hypothetical protein
MLTVDSSSKNVTYYISSAFSKLTSKPYILNTTEAKSFIYQENQTLVINSFGKMSKMYTVSLESETDKVPIRGLVQKLNIFVLPKDGKSAKTEAIITKITSSGLVYIDFNEKIAILEGNVTEIIGDSALQLTITDSAG